MKTYIWNLIDDTYRIQFDKIKGDRLFNKTRRSMLAHGWRFAGEGWDPAGLMVLLFDHDFAGRGTAKAWLKTWKLDPEWIES